MLAIIGGTGLYGAEGLEEAGQADAETPFGRASAAPRKGRWHGAEILFLPRHGERHELLPHDINYRANIFALKQAGATSALSVSACGSLNDAIAPGDLVLPSQFIDATKGRREASFFGGGVAGHISSADPVCAALEGDVAAAASRAGVSVHRGKTYVCVEGPRLGTRAESRYFKAIGGDIIGMTNVPEAFLAREAQIAYATLGICTDKDCPPASPDPSAYMRDLFAAYKKTQKTALAVIQEMLSRPLSEPSPYARRALEAAVLTAPEAMTAAQRAMLAVLRR